MKFFDNDPDDEGFQFHLPRKLSESEETELPDCDYFVEEDALEIDGKPADLVYLNAGNEVKASMIAYLESLPD